MRVRGQKRVMKISRAHLGQIIKEETQKILTEIESPTRDVAITRILRAAERRALRDARKEKEGQLTTDEMNVIKALHSIPDLKPPPPGPARFAVPEPGEIEDPLERYAMAMNDRIERATRNAWETHKPVEAQHKPLFQAYKKLHFDLLDLTDPQREWLGGQGFEGGTGGVIPRDVLRALVPHILDAIEEVENNQIDPKLQARLSRTQSAPPRGETAEEKQARKFQYNRASREFNLWRDTPYTELSRWLSQNALGKKIAKRYRVEVPGSRAPDPAAPFPGGPSDQKRFRKRITDKHKLEQHLLSLGYDREQLLYYITDPDKIFSKVQE